MKGASQLAPIGVRIPEDLKSKLKDRAARNGRSMNAEIIDTIESSFNEDNSIQYIEMQREIMQLHHSIAINQQMTAHCEEVIKQLSRHIELLEEHVKLLKDK